MKIKTSKKTSPRKIARLTKKIRIRKSVNGTEARPRLCVFRSAKHVYAQVINDETGTTILSVSSLGLKSDKSGKELSEVVGAAVAKLAIEKGIKNVVFDRNGFLYHGRVKAFADSCRSAGLNF